MREKVLLGQGKGFVWLNISLSSIPVDIGEHDCGGTVRAKNASSEWVVLMCEGIGCGFRQFVPQDLRSSEEISRWAREVGKIGEYAWRDRNAMKEALRRVRNLQE